jgi:hypothetical protein
MQDRRTTCLKRGGTTATAEGADLIKPAKRPPRKRKSFCGRNREKHKKVERTATDGAKTTLRRQEKEEEAGGLWREKEVERKRERDREGEREKERKRERENERKKERERERERERPTRGATSLLLSNLCNVDG